MNDRQLAVLMVEDSEDDAYLLARELERGGYHPLIERVQSAAALAAALACRHWDVVLSDYAMPGFDGLSAFRMVHARHGLDIPFIFVSGAIGDARAVEAMKLGVADYVLKDNLGRLIPAIDRELREAAMRRERRHMIAALEASEANFRTVIQDASHGVVVTREGKICYCNQTLATMFGHVSAAALIGTTYADLIAPDHRPAHAVGMADGETDEGFQRRGEFRGLRPDGAAIWIEERAQHSIWFGQPAVIYWVVDITERRRGEEALRQSEERYRALVEGSLHGLMITQDRKVVSCNQALADIFGYDSPREIVGRWRKDFVAPHEIERLRGYRVARESGESAPERYEFQGVRKDGSLVWLENAVQAIMWEGQASRQVSVVDISERKRSEEALRTSEERFRNLVEGSIQGTVITRKSTILFCNQAYAAMLGYERPEELIGRTHREFSPPEEHDRLASYSAARWEGAGTAPDAYEYRVQHRDGRVLWFERRVQMIEWEGAPALQSAIVDVTERKVAEEALRTSEERFRGLVENSIQGIAIVQDWRRVFCNRAFARMLGYERPEELIGLEVSEWISPEDRERRRASGEALLRGEAEPLLDTFAGFNRSGQKVWVQALSQVVTWEGRPALQVAYVDVTRSQQLEEHLLQTQKLEAIGSLAGGVAHDFNNVLSVILSCTEFLGESLPAEHPAQSDVREILKATQRAAGLTRQLLAFSRRQVLRLRVLSVNAVVRDMDKMLRRLIGEDIELVTTLDPDAGHINADHSQIEQIVMNLAVNARDAMPHGGKLTIATSVERLDEGHFQENIPLAPGRYARLTIGDTGVGIEESVRLRIFEPFFTTKEVGKGTGLGLSTVYGIVKQMGGHIWVDSKPRLGTTFKVYFPQAESPEKAGDETHPTPGPQELGGGEIVLVVEDEESVRGAVCRNLKQAGYTVIETRNGFEALALCAVYDGPIHLVLTDVVMPDMSGKVLADKILAKRPTTPILFMSGYTQDAIGRHGVLDEGVNFIEKPFTAQAALAKIHELLHPH